MEGGDDKKKIEEGRPDDAVLPQQLHYEKENETVAALDALPTNMGWKQIFHLPKEIRQLIIQGLEKPELYVGKMKEKIKPLEQSTGCVSCNAALSFSDEDLLLGSKPHNRPLYVSGYIRGQKVKRILIDEGSGVNLMPKATMNELGITMDELSSSRTMIHGFNLNGERVVGMIRVNLTMGDLSSDTLFHVMDVSSCQPPSLQQEKEKEVDKTSKTTTPVASPKKQETTQETTPPVLRYIPKSRRKDGESPFAECLTPKIEPKDKKSSLVYKQEWVAKVVTPLPSSSQTKIVRPPPNGFVCSSSQSSSEENKGIFDSNAYKLLAKAGYDFTNPTPLGKVMEVETYGLNKAQHEVFKQDGSFMVTRVGLGYESLTPVKIGARRKGATASSHHITVEEVEENEGEQKMHPSSVFDRISPPAEKCRPSIFTRLGRQSASTKHISVFARLGNQGESKVKVSTPSLCINKKGAIHERLGGPSKIVFSRLGAPKKNSSKGRPLSTSPTQSEEEVRVSDDLRSAIPSRMKRIQVVDIIQHEPLKARRRVLVLTGQQNYAEELVSSSSRPYPRPIYVSALLTKEEEEEYYKLFVKYKDVFAWSYKEMPGLSPKIAVHRLAIKKGTSPKKQPQRRFRPELVPEIEKEVNKIIEAGFIREVKYSTWIANIVPVRKKNGQLRICVDFRDLNDACPKDDFPLPIRKQQVFEPQKEFSATQSCRLD
ncbi:uncharacterized protein LOC141629114 [Silene latifolia]|uniref:uncharacterized protein LOC141629114 n=1 Tax=Silene latifolia TaxID=37657 RepID=UPI003D777617